MKENLPDIARNVIELLLESAQRYPDRPALELYNSTYTYRELLVTASGIAFYIDSVNDSNPYIGVVADKSFYCYASILGVLLAGKAYLPLNPRFPEARNRYMTEKARVNTILDSSIIEQKINNQTKYYEYQIKNTKNKIQNSDYPAYLLFTSGTTGQPKGVPVSHKNLSAYLNYMLKAYHFSLEDRFTQIFDLTFDLSVHDMFLAWSSGACLCVPEDNTSFAMSKFIKDKKPTVWFSVPSVVNLMERMRLLKPDVFPSVRLSFFCGEALKIQTAFSWKRAAGHSRLVNLYGPTEATIAIARYDIPEELSLCKSELGVISIGKIFPENSFRIDQTDENGHGELCLTGDQVVQGYYENKQADLDSFFIDPGSHRKFYRTGDMVWMDKDDDLFYLGRKDSEVKISGYRVNLKEIENLLETQEMVYQAVVIFKQDETETGTLLAFIVPDSSVQQADSKLLLKACRENLPWYMVPGKLIFVEDIPLNPNGKVDKAALLKKYHDGN